jgi:hypothetical protein
MFVCDGVLFPQRTVTAFKRICLAAALSLSGTLFLLCPGTKLRSPAPTYVTFTVPNSTGTFPTCINNLLTVAGYYNIGNDGQSEAFVRATFQERFRPSRWAA